MGRILGFGRTKKPYSYTQYLIDSRRREKRLSKAEKAYATFFFEWPGEAWWGLARRSANGCYAMVAYLSEDFVCRYVPVGRQPQTPLEAFRALRAEAAEAVRKHGVPSRKAIAIARDGDQAKLEARMEPQRPQFCRL
jgi:hypothetical protein